MATYKRQIEMTRAAHMASRAVSDASVFKLDSLWEEFDKGKITIQEYSRQVRQIVRSAYRDSAKVSKNLSRNLSELEDWSPSQSLVSSDYLSSLISDVNKNVKRFSEGLKDEKAKRELKLRIELSALTAASRGFTDAQLTYYQELENLGFRVVKVWLANFVNNEPCAHCRALHNTRVPLNQEFPIPTLMRTAIYRDLQGPPLHVRCKCMMVVLIQRAENFFERIPVSAVSPSSTMTTETVKSLPVTIFDNIVRVLRMITGRRDGKG